jgi:hypothetical protein
MVSLWNLGYGTPPAPFVVQKTRPNSRITSCPWSSPSGCVTCDVNSGHEQPSCCHCHSIELPFICRRGEIAQSCLPPLPVIENLYVLDDLPDPKHPLNVSGSEQIVRYLVHSHICNRGPTIWPRGPGGSSALRIKRHPPFWARDAVQ